MRKLRLWVRSGNETLQHASPFNYLFPASPTSKVNKVGTYVSIGAATETQLKMIMLRHVARKTVGTHTIRTRSIQIDRKSTRLNSSHVASSYAVFCLKK